MSYTLIIAEKPSAARKIAVSIAEGPVKTQKVGTVSYMELERNKKKIVVVSAVGHLFTLKQKGTNWTYPIFDVEWRPMFEVNKTTAYTKEYYNVIKKLVKDADEFVIATDLDVEGETIAFNILRYICGVEDAKRMEFSTMTSGDLVNAYDNAKPHINRGRAEAGVTRHMLDFYFGINVSRALMLAIKSTGNYKVLSSGRVQGPALAFLAARELEIKAFIPDPYWQIEFLSKLFTAMYEVEKIWDKSKAEEIYNDCIGNNATVSKIEKNKYKQKVPTPFNLTDLQVEAHKLFAITPKDTQAIAQKLYEMAVISYPRTSSQKLPEKLDFRSILSKLSKNKDYINIVDILLKTKLKPNEGPKTDEAHPAIHPTGELPSSLVGREHKIYDLIVKRFFAVFGIDAIRESMTIVLDVKTHKFNVLGKRTIEPNWFELYAPYVKLEEVTLPDMKIGDMVDVTKFNFIENKTKPPNRYNQASIIRALEKRDLGTKATRAEIVNNLYKRGYLVEKRIEVTDLGLKVIETLDKYCPKIISEDLTRHFEKDMELIGDNKLESEKVLDTARTELTIILEQFKKNEFDIGNSLIDSVRKERINDNILGECPKCKVGNLTMMKSRIGKPFVGCSNYPKCDNIFPLPGFGMIKKTGTVCEKCQTPIVQIISKGKKPWKMCLDTKCETKANWGKRITTAKTVTKSKTAIKPKMSTKATVIKSKTVKK
ncbi:MAG: DNA topoisomerase I [DPANN group archaeon]|nr:DNA topoisomerase I [DPANN group archaeon]